MGEILEEGYYYAEHRLEGFAGYLSSCACRVSSQILLTSSLVNDRESTTHKYEIILYTIIIQYKI